MKMKKALMILLTVLLACGVFPAGAFAEEQGLFLYEIKEDGTAEITGISDTTITALEIPAELDGIPVTSVGDFAFGHCGSIVSVTIPEGVTSIGTLAFGNCYVLESVSIPDSLVSIGMSAFRSERLTEIVVSPDHPVFAVENEALIDKRDRTLVRFLAPEITGTYEIAQGIRAIGPDAFELNERLSRLVIPDSVTEIGMDAMAYCYGLKEIVIPDSVTSIGNLAFFRCTGLESVTIPDSVTEIGADAFNDCQSLTAISISPDHPVYEVIDLLVVEKDSKTVIAASGAIRGKAAVPEGIRAIGMGAFRGCRYLEELFVPDDVKRIGGQAFNSNTVVRACAGSAAQKYCAADSSVRFAEITPEEYAEEVRKLEQEKADGEPAGSAGALHEEDGSLRVSGMYQYSVLEDGTALIVKADPFLTDGNIPAELDGIPVTRIGFDAFSNCAGLQSVVIPEGVVYVSGYVFMNCTRLESVSIPDSLAALDAGAFAYCRTLKTIEVSPDHPVFAVENRALVNKRDQTLILVLDREDTGTYTVTQGIWRIEGNAFYKSSFSSVILPDSVTSVGSLAFYDCDNLTEFVLPEGVASVGSQVFLHCEKLESVTIPDSLTRIGSAVFSGSPVLTDIRISPDHPAYEMIGPLLVDKRDQEIAATLSSMPAVYEIPEGIRAIGGRGFEGCEDLTELIVPEGMIKIGENAFSGCGKLRAVTLPASLNEIGDEAFRYSRELLIRAPAGSWAEQYARENGYRFEALSEVTQEKD